LAGTNDAEEGDLHLLEDTSVELHDQNCNTNRNKPSKNTIFAHYRTSFASLQILATPYSRYSDTERAKSSFQTTSPRIHQYKMADAIQDLTDIPKDFFKDGTTFLNRCTKRTSPP
jgi:ABC-type sulfate transport system substrate-binding protein